MRGILQLETDQGVIKAGCSFLCYVVNVLVPVKIWVDCSAKVFRLTYCLELRSGKPLFLNERNSFVSYLQHPRLVRLELHQPGSPTVPALWDLHAA